MSTIARRAYDRALANECLCHAYARAARTERAREIHLASAAYWRAEATRIGG